MNGDAISMFVSFISSKRESLMDRKLHYSDLFNNKSETCLPIFPYFTNHLKWQSENVIQFRLEIQNWYSVFLYMNIQQSNRLIP